MVAVNFIEWQTNYPMDFYANSSLGPWTPNHEQCKLGKRRGKPKKAEVTEVNEGDKEQCACAKEETRTVKGLMEQR